MQQDYVIEVKDVYKSFKKQEVLKGINVKFEKGKIYGLVGRNGSGKTVLLKCIMGLIRTDKGEILVGKKRIGKDVETPENIGAIIENPGFLNNYSAFKNLKFLANINKKITDEQIKEYINKVGLNPEEKKGVGKYSLGMRQRLAIAQSIMEDQQIILLDEPMNGLDKAGVEDIRAILKELKNEGKTIVLASHSSEDINVLCDSVYEMDLGKITKIR